MLIARSLLTAGAVFANLTHPQTPASGRGLGRFYNDRVAFRNVDVRLWINALWAGSKALLAFALTEKLPITSTLFFFAVQLPRINHILPQDIGGRGNR